MADVEAPQSKSKDLDKLLLRGGNLVSPDFYPGAERRHDIREHVKILVVGVGGLGYELLKDLALSGFRNLDVIDMDRIEVTNLNRQFLLRLEDVGKPKAEVAAKRVMERVSGVQNESHYSGIEDNEIEFYNDFNIIALGLDSIEARRYINGVALQSFQIDPSVSMMIVEEKPDVTYNDVGGCKEQIEKMRYVFVDLVLWYGV